MTKYAKNTRITNKKTQEQNRIKETQENWKNIVIKLLLI